MSGLIQEFIFCSKQTGVKSCKSRERPTIESVIKEKMKKYRLKLLVHSVSHLTSESTLGGQTDIAL